MSLRWRVKEFLSPLFKSLYERIVVPPPPNELGVRDVEYSFIAANIPPGPGIVIDYGCGKSWMPLLAVRKGHKVIGVDITDPKWYYSHQELTFSSFLPDWKEKVSLVINCSVIEHIGLGRYGDPLEVDGDLRVMEELRRLLDSTGLMLMTTPIGKDKVVPGVHRIYGEARLSLLLENWKIVKEEYWIKDALNKWIEVPKEKALLTEGSDHHYSIGLFVLRP